MSKKSLIVIVLAVAALRVVIGVVQSSRAAAPQPTSTPGIVATEESTPPPPTATPGGQIASATATPTIVNLTPLPSVVSGVVTDANGPVIGATVQIQGTTIVTTTSNSGTFLFSGITGTTPIVVTAWSTGHYVGWKTLNPSAPDWQGGTGINVSLRYLPQKDNSQYGWYSFDGVKGSAACGLCHREYKEWQADAHGQAATNQRFLTMYAGTNVQGEQGQDIKFGSNGVALPPDPSKPYFGPGFRTDMPGRSGSCATCHTPMASKASNSQNCTWSGCHTDFTIEHSNGQIGHIASPQFLTGDAAEGISCEFCHKIGDVILDPKTNLPFPDMPGILSLRLYRPADDTQQVFFGTLVDVSRPDSFLPLLSESKFCAGCHYGVFGGVVGMNDVKGGTLIYNSYGEWLSSPYSDPKTGKTCQDCHMPVSDAKWFVFPDKGGLVRDHANFHNHTMPGAVDERLLQNSVSLKGTAQRDGSQVSVTINVTNDKTGHYVPTDAPIRSMILVVEAVDADGKVVPLANGPVNPAYSGNFGGVAGKTFAKVLKDGWTGEVPTAAFWRPVTIVEDSRLAPLATDTSKYTFTAPTGKAVTVNVRLIYRRAFADLMKQKGWTDPDILMGHETIEVAAK